MRIFKSKWFERFARRKRITDAKLSEAVRNAERGVIDADYGAGVIKQRVARPGAGKSGGYRLIILFRATERAFVVYGLAKSDQDNIDESDEKDFKELAKVPLYASDAQLKGLLDDGKFIEVDRDDQSEHKQDQDVQE